MPSHTCGASHAEDWSPTLDTWPCQGSDECLKRLCSKCPQFRCERCDLRSCMEHRVAYQGQQICAECYLAECLAFTTVGTEVVQ